MMALFSSEGSTDRTNCINDILASMEREGAQRFAISYYAADGDPITGYFGCTFRDLQIFGQAIQDEATCRMIAANHARIADMTEDIIAEEAMQDSEADID